MWMAICGRPFGEQDSNEGSMTPVSRKRKSRLPEIVRCIEGCSPGDKEFTHIRIAFKRGQHQQSPRELIRQVGAQSSIEFMTQRDKVTLLDQSMSLVESHHSGRRAFIVPTLLGEFFRSLLVFGLLPTL